MGVYPDSACEGDKIDAVTFVQDPEDPHCWSMNGSNPWAFTAACEDGKVSIHAFEHWSCTGTPYFFVTDIPLYRAVAFFQGSGCEPFH